MKFIVPESLTKYEVAPRRGAWIEILDRLGMHGIRVVVAPRRGAWIEIRKV